MHTIRWTRVTLVFVLLAACGDDDDVRATPDAAIAIDGGASTPAPPEAPRIAWLDPVTLLEGEPPIAPPAPPVWTCPTGWSTVAASGSLPARCAPWSETPAECGAGELRAPGEPACRPLGAACASDGWPVLAASSAPVLYVRAGASAGGTGTRTAPFPRVADALAAVTAPGTVVAVATGTYDELLTVGAGSDVVIIGACPTGTTLRAPTADDMVAAIEVSGGTLTLRDLAITGPRRGVRASAGGALTLEHVRVHDVRVQAVLVVSGTLSAHDVLIESVGPRSSDGFLGRAIDVQEGTTATVERAVLRDLRNTGIIAWDPGTTLVVRDTVVRDVESHLNDGRFGDGIAAQPGASVTLERVVVERVRRVGLLVLGPDTTLSASDFVVRDVRTVAEDGVEGYGAAAFTGGALTLSRGSIERVHTHGVYAVNAGSSASAIDVVIDDVDANNAPDRSFGEAAAVSESASLTLSRVAMRELTEIAVLVGAGTTLDASDLRVDTVRPSLRSDAFGIGSFISQLGGSQLTVRRAVFESGAVLGAFFNGEGTVATLEDVRIGSVTAARIERVLYATGVLADEGASITLRRATIGPARGALSCRLMATCTLEDVVTEGGESLEFAAAVSATEGGTIDLTAVRVRGAAGLAVVADREGVITARELIIDEMLPATETVRLDAQSYGIAAMGGGQIELNRARIVAPEIGGVCSLTGGSLRITDLSIENGAGARAGTYPEVALVAFPGSTIELSRARFDSNRGYGAYVGGALTATDLVVLATLPRSCAADTCSSRPAGSALVVDGTGVATVDRFQLESSALAGVQLLDGGELTLRGGVIRGNAIGVNLQDTDYEISRLQNDVMFIDNAVTLDARILPVEMPVSPLPPPSAAPPGT